MESCNDKSQQKGPSVVKTLFGKLSDTTEVFNFHVTNINGLSMDVITYGGIIRTLSVPDKSGKFDDVVLGYDSLSQYLEFNPYFGCIVGRFANRIANGIFSLDSTEYNLAVNNGVNHLHGGISGFDKVNWNAREVLAADHVGVELSYYSEDGEEGYPGNLEVVVTYLLTNDNELIFSYQARTDKKTVINLTNHSYFNLRGSGDILGHILEINADNYLAIDETQIPLSPENVENSPFDFRSPKTIGRDIESTDLQIKRGNGYDHCFVINKGMGELALAAVVTEPESGRKMEVFTTEPGVQLYTGNFLRDLNGKGGKKYGKRLGFCLETQHFPNSPNRSDFPSVVLEPGETFISKTITRFSY